MSIQSKRIFRDHQRRQTNGWSSRTRSKFHHPPPRVIQTGLGTVDYFRALFEGLIPPSVDRMSPDSVIGLLVLIFATVPPPSHVVAWTLPPPAKVHQLVESLLPRFHPAARPSSSNSPSSPILPSSPVSPDLVTQTAVVDSVLRALIFQN
ncbi:hypothetical protein A1Q1_05996 [Trichosporon asahii var. asahii CBS 2479]|uniref:Uncharacterized protein n=1 Tax=Trichosporon asahii var. asahii (strain ATCC 90039 / CBS 2479 / JCM 2466 / KCTC 7840 / NBRC 103889/ NCYC 2677 / UAMH 7654) TaxID=1186058 RepID=J4U649_TRIAS|nr:hypothetical protein A1Q1_05996 [Trichosporon asahii var. asahii CBS 2479]EJT45550.1 hypothetical protein A1Q1_05996 [Trichosporon asahii var. asahii CBS 2479]